MQPSPGDGTSPTELQFSGAGAQVAASPGSQGSGRGSVGDWVGARVRKWPCGERKGGRRWL